MWNNTEVCSVFEPAQTFMIGTGLSAAFAIGGLIANGILMRKLSKTSVLPSNSKVIMFNMTLGAFLFDFTSLFRILYQMTIISNGFKGISTRLCKIVASPESCCATVLSVCLPVLALERWISICKPRSTSPIGAESNDKVSKALKVTIGLLWCSGIVTLAVEFSASSGPELCFCHMMFTMMPLQYAVMSLGILAIAVSSLAAYLVLWFRVKRKWEQDGINRALHNLNDRFSLWQTLMVTKTVLPAVAANCFCVSVMVVVSVPLAQLELSSDMFGALCLLHVLASSYTFVHPLLCMFMNDKLRPLKKSNGNKSGAAVEFRFGPDRAQMVAEAYWIKQ